MSDTFDPGLPQNGTDPNTRLPGTFDSQERTWTPPVDRATAQKFIDPYLLDEPVPTMLLERDLSGEHAAIAAVDTRAVNVDDQDRPHFLRNVDGEEVCGQDGKPWPCDRYTAMLEQDQAERTGTPDQQPPTTGGADDLDRVASVLNMSRAELDRMLAEDAAGQALPGPHEGGPS